MKSPCATCDEHQRHITEEKKVAGAGKVAGKNEPGCRDCEDRLRFANRNLGIPLDTDFVPLPPPATRHIIGYPEPISEQKLL